MAQVVINGTVIINGSNVGNALMQMLMADDIQPGDAPSYQLCKTIQTYHPLGKKLTDTPIIMAQSQERIIAVQSGPEELLKDAFIKQWKRDKVDRQIANLGRLARTYGVSSLALKQEGVAPTEPIDFTKIWDQPIAFSVFDPLNTAGSLVLNQDPNAMDFQAVTSIVVNGQPYNRSRTVVLMHEDPIYIDFTSSAFGYVGRSVFQRCLYALKSFIQTMIADDMVSLKAGVLIAKIKTGTSLTDRTVAAMAGLKRAIVQEAVTNNVISISPDEDIETLNLQNVNTAMAESRKDIIQNIATGADMPSMIINEETFARGMAEGTEDAKYIAQYVASIRTWLDPAYEWADQIIQRRAWTPALYASIQAEYPEYNGVSFESAFQEWKNGFEATWPNLLEEPDSEKVRVDDVKLKAVIAWVQVLLTLLDPPNQVRLLRWACDTFNGLKLLFPTALLLEWDELADHLEEQQEQSRQIAAEGGEGDDEEGKPGGGKQIKMSSADSASGVISLKTAMDGLTAAIDALPAPRERHRARG